jgi:hypothetical protein
VKRCCTAVQSSNPFCSNQSKYDYVRVPATAAATTKCNKANPVLTTPKATMAFVKQEQHNAGSTNPENSVRQTEPVTLTVEQRLHT